MEFGEEEIDMVVMASFKCFTITQSLFVEEFFY